MDTRAGRLEASLATQIRMELVGCAMDQQDLADAVTVGRATMNRYLRGHRSMPMPVFFSVAEVLRIPPHVLLERAAARISG